MNEVAEIPGTALIEYGVTEAVLAELRQFWDGIDKVTDDNYDTVKAGCKTLVTLRTSIETKRNEYLTDARAYTDAVNTEAKRVTGLVAAIEAPAKVLKLKYDDAQTAVKAKAEAKEQTRRDNINAAIDMIDSWALGLDGLTVEQLSERLRELKVMAVDEAIYAEFLAVAQERMESARAKVEAARYRRIEFEAEQRRLKEQAEALEAQRVADEEKRVAEQADIDRQRAEIEADRKKLADEQTVRNAEEARIAREAQEAEDAAAQEQRDKEIAAEAATAERERLEREAQDAELAAAEAAELAPDKDKLLTYARAIAELSAAAPTLEHAKAQKMLERGTDALDGIANGLMDWAGKV
jgi:hypothetical protein